MDGARERSCEIALPTICVLAQRLRFSTSNEDRIENRGSGGAYERDLEIDVGVCVGLADV
jgi:hypothetical protein